MLKLFEKFLEGSNVRVPQSLIEATLLADPTIDKFAKFIHKLLYAIKGSEAELRRALAGSKGLASWRMGTEPGNFANALWNVLTRESTDTLSAVKRNSLLLMFREALELPLDASIADIRAKIIEMMGAFVQEGRRGEAEEKAEKSAKAEGRSKISKKARADAYDSIARQLLQKWQSEPWDDDRAFDIFYDSLVANHPVLVGRSGASDRRDRKAVKEKLNKLIEASPPVEAKEPEEPVQTEIRADAVPMQELMQQQINFAAEIAGPPIDPEDVPDIDPINSNLPQPPPVAQSERKWADPDAGGDVNAGAGGRPENLFTASLASAIPGSEPIEQKHGVPPSVARNFADRDVDIGNRDDNRDVGPAVSLRQVLANANAIARGAKSRMPGVQSTFPGTDRAKTALVQNVDMDPNERKRREDVVQKIMDDSKLEISNLESEGAPDSVFMGVRAIAGVMAEAVAMHVGNVGEWMSQIDYADLIRSALMGLPLLQASLVGQSNKFGIPASLIVSELGLAGLDAILRNVRVQRAELFPDDDPSSDPPSDPSDGPGDGDGGPPGGGDFPGDPPGGDGGPPPGGGGGPPPGGGGDFPDHAFGPPPPGWRDILRRLSGHLGTGVVAVSQAGVILTTLASSNPRFNKWMVDKYGKGWENFPQALKDAVGYFRALKQGRVGPVPKSIKRALKWGEKKIDLSPADKAAIQQAFVGDIKPMQDQDKERRVGDLRPSFKQLGTIADDETAEEALRERMKFAAFNYVKPGHGASRDNVIARTNRAWDEQIRFNTPINTARYQKYPLRQLVDFRAPMGISANRGYTNPMSIGLLRNSMERAGISHDMLLRDIHNNQANFQPVMGINRVNPSIPLSNMYPSNMDWAGYYATDAVNNPPEGTDHFIVRQRGLNPGPYKQLPAGFSSDLPPYQFNTYYDNAYPMNGHPQFVQSKARGSNDVSYEPIRSRMPAGLDISAMSLLPRVPLNFADPRTGNSVSGSTLKFPQTIESIRA
jgi:hypothetical protein